MEDHLRHYFLKALHDRFPESSDSIRDRLCSTMLLRRKRILYRRKRYSAQPAALPLPASKPVATIEARPTQWKQEQRQETAQLAIPPSIIHSTTQSATILVSQDFQRASAPSVVSRTKTVDLSAHEDLFFPPIPRSRSQAVVEKICPYCLFALPALDTTTQARWRSVNVFTPELDVLKLTGPIQETCSWRLKRSGMSL